MRDNSIKCRAEMVNRMFQWADKSDARIVFFAMSRFDRFYENRDLLIVSPDELSITAFAAFLMIAEKQNNKMAASFMQMNKKFCDAQMGNIMHRKLELVKLRGGNRNYTLMHDCISAFSLIMRKSANEQIESRLTDQHMSEIDVMVRAFAKSILIDVELHQYCQIKLVAGLYSAAYEILRTIRGNKDREEVFKVCEETFGNTITVIFEPEDLDKLHKFGHFIVLRQQKIYHMHGKGENALLPYIYSELSVKLYEHTHFEHHQRNPVRAISISKSFKECMRDAKKTVGGHQKNSF